MSSNWHVYKIFKNGKRAKAPIYEFEHEGDMAAATSHFDSKIKIKVSEKFGHKTTAPQFIVVNSADAHAHSRETEDEREKLFLAKRTRVLLVEARRKNLPIAKNHTTGLLMGKDTNWKWQWVLMEAGTSRFRGAISEEFTTHSGAVTWIQQKINQL